MINQDVFDAHISISISLTSDNQKNVHHNSMKLTLFQFAV